MKTECNAASQPLLAESEEEVVSRREEVEDNLYSFCASVCRSSSTFIVLPSFTLILYMMLVNSDSLQTGIIRWRTVDATVFLFLLAVGLYKSATFTSFASPNNLRYHRILRLLGVLAPELMMGVVLVLLFLFREAAVRSCFFLLLLSTVVLNVAAITYALLPPPDNRPTEEDEDCSVFEHDDQTQCVANDKEVALHYVMVV